jgi:hypothetical protein
MKLTLNADCDCGCKGWWDYCQDNKANRSTFKLSPCPSPCRTDDDWFKKDDNPLCIGKSNISITPSLPETNLHRISAKYLSSCVDRYFNKEN